MKWLAITEIVQFAVLVAGLAITYFDKVMQAPADARQTLQAIFLMILVAFGPDKAGNVVKAIIAARPPSPRSESVNGEPGIRHFDDHAAAMEFCMATAELAIRILNTVMWTPKGGPIHLLYGAWRRKKLSTIRRGTVWAEIVSSNLPLNHPQFGLMDKLQREASDRYRGTLIDERVNPIQQMTIFHLKDGRKEMVLGWNSPQGPCFLITDEQVIADFEEQFDRYLRIGKDRPPRPLFWRFSAWFRRGRK